MATKKTKKPKVVKNAKPTPKKKGRPTDYNNSLADRICNEISTSNKGLYHICKDNEDFPHPSTVYDWIAKHKIFADKYARARELQADMFAAEVVMIADTPCEGIKVISKPTGDEITKGDMTEHRRLQMDARKWASSKLAPKKYGDKIQTEHSGEVTVTQITGMKVQ